MSSAGEEKSDDKKDIEMEEREKIMNRENAAQDCGGVDTKEMVSKLNKTEIKEGREVKPKKIPIGGIQMPGFFTRSRSKEKCKDSESDQGGADTAAEGSELLEGDSKPVDQSQQRKSLIDTIRIPLVSVFPRKSKQDLSSGGGGAAGLASMETLDDTDKSADKKDEDDMKNVKLDADDKTDVEKQDAAATAASDASSSCGAKVRAYRVVISALLVFVLILIVIIVLILPGRQLSLVPLKDGRYVEAVTSCGLVEGVLEDGAFAFRGIPYALPPIDEQRWRPAHQLDNLDYCWNGTLLAHNATPVCAQIYANGSLAGTEDCLTLDVVTPYVRYDTPLPVIVMIGGESLAGGSPGKMRPSPRYARARDVLFVRPNFRVGALGFLALDAISKAVHPPTSGNYGLSDIIRALEWVQLNIQHFGGDARAVTLFGHRAGATLVTALASSEHATKLFARAWATSGAAIFPGKPLAEAEQASEEYLAGLQCRDIACLRALSAEQLMEAVPDTWRKASPDLPARGVDPDTRHEWLVLDGKLLKQHPGDVWSREEGGLPVQLVLGTTAHAAASDKLLLRHGAWTPELVRGHIEHSLLGKLNLTEDTLTKYPATYRGLVSLVSDIRTVCPLLAIAAQQQKHVPFYVVTQPRGAHDLADVDSDVDAILGRYEPRSPEQRRYVAAMQQLFYHYVWHGEVLLAEPATNRVLVVGQDVIPAANYTHCDFWINSNIVPKYAQLD